MENRLQIDFKMNMSLRILWVSEVVPDPNSGAGGTELQMVRQLRLLGHDVTTIWEDQIPRRIRHGNLHYALELPKAYARVIAAAVRKETFDVVTVNLGQSFQAARMLRKQNFPGVFIVRSHGLDDHLDVVLAQWRKKLGLPPRPWLKEVLGKRLTCILHGHMAKAARVCDGYVVSNSLDARWLNATHGLAEEKIAVVPQAPAMAFCRTPAPLMTNSRLKRILYVANFHFAKGPRDVAQCVEAVLAAHPDVEMTWICRPDDHEQVRNLFSARLPDRVRLIGWMPQDQLVEQFDQHGIFLYPSLFDGFGKVFLEAMSRGMCVVGTHAGGMVDLLRHRENGLVCDFNSSSQMMLAVEDLLKNPSMAVQFSESAVNTASQYTWERAGKSLESFFRRRLEAASVTAR